MQRSRQPLLPTLALGALGLFTTSAAAQLTLEPPMLETNSPVTVGGWTATALVTIGETLGSYQPCGRLDGIGAFASGPDRARVLVSHELYPNSAYAYSLANGPQLTGARISAFEIERTINSHGNAVVDVLSAGPAYIAIFDRGYRRVTHQAQLNQTGAALAGISRLCSGQAIAAGSYGFEDDLFLTGEETATPTHPYGGTLYGLDVRRKVLWSLPAIGRGAWENATPLETGDPRTVALLLGNDTAGAPLYLYVGQKRGLGSERFLDRNGLLKGRLYAWRADNGDLSPQQFNGLNSSRSGRFVEVTVRDRSRAGSSGYDAQGYANDATLHAEADALGCFSFSRPEDLTTHPQLGTRAIFSSTGYGSQYPADNWGTLYLVDVSFSDLSCDLVILHDADGLVDPDKGIRSPDNLDWADDGKVYVQEDRSTSPHSLFGASTGIEASIWELDPVTRRVKRIATIDRNVVVPAGTTDSGAGDLGNWETSGILDVTRLFGTRPGERLLIGTVQAHGIRDGAIGGSALLEEGGQLFFLSKIGN